MRLLRSGTRLFFNTLHKYKQSVGPRDRSTFGEIVCAPAWALVLSIDGKYGRYHTMTAALRPKRKVVGMYFCQPKSTKRPCANDAPPRPEKTAKILRTVALKGRDGLLLRPASRIFCCFFIHPGAARRSHVAHAPDPGTARSVVFLGYTFHFRELTPLPRDSPRYRATPVAWFYKSLRWRRFAICATKHGSYSVNYKYFLPAHW